MTTSVQKFCGVKGLYSITNLEIIIEDRGTNLEVDSLRFPALRRIPEQKTSAWYFAMKHRNGSST